MATITQTSSNQEPGSSDLSPCPKCGVPLAGPLSTDYLGLGRILHSWHCQACGEKFRTSARMAGMIELEPEPAVAVA